MLVLGLVLPLSPIKTYVAFVLHMASDEHLMSPLVYMNKFVQGAFSINCVIYQLDHLTFSSKIVYSN